MVFSEKDHELISYEKYVPILVCGAISDPVVTVASTITIPTNNPDANNPDAIQAPKPGQARLKEAYPLSRTG